MVPAVSNVSTSVRSLQPDDIDDTVLVYRVTSPKDLETASALRLVEDDVGVLGAILGDDEVTQARVDVARI